MLSSLASIIVMEMIGGATVIDLPYVCTAQRIGPQKALE
jgi:hypothetical protein